MSSNLPNSRGPTVPECRLLAIDALCDRFEAAWRTGEGPAIEDFLALGPPGCEDDLFRYLLAVELDYHRRSGVRPPAADYRARFPGRASLIDSTFDDDDRRAAGGAA